MNFGINDRTSALWLFPLSGVAAIGFAALLTLASSTAIATDTFHHGTSGNDVINGIGDSDVLFATHLPSQYVFDNGVVRGVEGNDTLQSVEFLGFGYGFQNPVFEINVRVEDLIDPDGDGPQLSPVTLLLQQISDLYVAYFNRAPDDAGLTFWFKEIYRGHFTLFDTAKSFTDQPEYAAAYPPGLNNRDFIERIYDNLFDRIPDDAGWDYWDGQLNNGMPRDTFILTVINGAYAPTGSDTDKALLNNKHDASMYYVEQVSLNPDEGFDNSISEVLNNVSADASTVNVARTVIDHVMSSEQSLTDVVAVEDWWETFAGTVVPTAEEFFADNVNAAIVQARCINCHVAGGLSGHTPLVYLPANQSNHVSHNFDTIDAYLRQSSNAVDTILTKAQGIGHGGGIQLRAGSEDFVILQQFLTLLEEAQAGE